MNPEDAHHAADVPLEDCPRFFERVNVFTSACATYHAPSDPSGRQGMHKSRIRATARWRTGGYRFDCVFVDRGSPEDGIAGLEVARVRLFLSFRYALKTYECALVHWFGLLGDRPDPLTGMWMVQPEMDPVCGGPKLEIIPLQIIERGAHLMARFPSTPFPARHQYYKTLSSFSSFYINNYIDHHAFERIREGIVSRPSAIPVILTHVDSHSEAIRGNLKQ